MFEFSDAVATLAQRLVAGGAVVTLTLICLLYYVGCVVRNAQSRKVADLHRLEVSGLEEQLSELQRERTVARYESQALREFLVETDTVRALQSMLRKVVTQAERGWCAFVRVTSGETTTLTARGLSSESGSRLTIDAGLVERLRNEGTVVLAADVLRPLKLWEHLGPRDRAKTRELYLFRVGPADRFDTLLLTTELPPVVPSVELRLEMVERLVASIGGNILHRLAYVSQESELRRTNDVMQLRAITDRSHESPLKMLQEFLLQIQTKTASRRVALFLVSNDGSAPKAPIVSMGKPSPPHAEELWSTHEVALARLGVDRPVLLEDSHLPRCGVDSLIRSALVSPVSPPGGGRVGLLVLTRVENRPYEGGCVDLVMHATTFLAETILRVINQLSIEKQARTDGLTGLANRRTFDEELEAEMRYAMQSGRECSLVMVDLDHFKSVNDRYGHPAGDDVLRYAAGCLRRAVARLRASDRPLAARYGGEELAVLLPGVGGEGAARIASLIRESIGASPVAHDGNNISVTASLGVACYPTHATSATELMAAADGALYQAKKNGRNRVESAAQALAVGAL